MFQFKKNTKVLKNDMNKIAENLEKIRDMFINKGENGKIDVMSTLIKKFWEHGCDKNKNFNEQESRFAFKSS